MKKDVLEEPMLHPLGINVDRRAGTRLTTFKGDSDLESKITSLQKMLKERDATIVQLRDEIAVINIR